LLSRKDVHLTLHLLLDCPARSRAGDQIQTNGSGEVGKSLSMRTERTVGCRTRGWIFYDAHCPSCRTVIKLFGGILARRGYEWEPLQTPDVANRLGLSEAALLEEMKLQLSDDRVVGAIDSWIVLFHSVWWLWPLGFLLSLPGFHAVGQACYRRVARRYSFGCKCDRSQASRRHRTIPFLDLP
jgi:predicted DCC family thiol-disulfide oxidoreductase YuxK